MKLNKRGLSDVVTTGLIILLAIAAVIIVWSFIRPAITNVGESIDTQCIQLELTPVSCSTAATGRTVAVKMSAGNTILAGIKLIYYTGAGGTGSSQARDNGAASIPPRALETTTITPLSAPTEPVLSVKVAGVVTVNGKAQTCPESDKFVACA